jgi:hypothetical protein
MSGAASTPSRLEDLLAAFLRYGTWLASAAIGLGFSLVLFETRFGRNPGVQPDLRIATLGVLLFILLPAVRVLLMFLFFLREADYRLAFIAALVLSVILLGLFIGVRMTSARSTPLLP